ncbi:hypothetical protein V8F33_003901 [Rhypophila sp. PSN 637]
MAFPVAGGNNRTPIPLMGSGYSLESFPVKRRNTPDLDDGSGDGGLVPRPKRLRYTQYADHVAFKAADEQRGFPPMHTHLYPHHHPHPRPHHQLRHSRSQCSSPEPGSHSMERTASGHSIRSDPTEGCARTELLADEEAAQRVRDHMATFRRRNPDSKHERILRSIINPRPNTDYALDKEALESIFSAANEIFFNGRLSQRVMWDWSHESSGKYDKEIIGTTALRRASNRGFETLIVLSSPILHDAKYSRRLLISTFLHELIHSYMFICCGFRARHCGGHTPGFQTIAELIDAWVGPESGLYLGCMEADLERFRVVQQDDQQHDDDEGRYSPDGWRSRTGYDNVYFPCSGLSEQQQDSFIDLSTRDQNFSIGYSTTTHDINASTWWTQRAVVRPQLYTDEEIPAHHTFYVDNNDKRAQRH